MLHELLTKHRAELIQRCREKVAKRMSAPSVPAAVDHGVPLFLQQLADTLQDEQLTRLREVDGPTSVPSGSEIGRGAALHGAELLRRGFSIDQVVHEYGDVCQSVTDLAVEENSVISADEFRTLNRCLDDAIADAVASFGHIRQEMVKDQADSLHLRLDAFSDEHRKLVDVAILAYSAVRTGNVGLTGATGRLLMQTLNELRSLTERKFLDIRLASATTTVAPH